MSTPARPFQVSHASRRAQLSRHFISALEPLLTHRRWVDLSVEDITTAGGIARSTFYKYFADRGELLCAMADDVLDEIFVVGQNWWDLPDDAGVAELRKALLPAIEARVRHGALLSAVTEGAAADGRLRERQVRLIDKLADDLAAHITHAQQVGSASPDLDPPRTAKWLLWTFDRALYELILPAGEDETEKLLDAVTMIIWRTVYVGFRNT